MPAPNKRLKQTARSSSLSYRIGLAILIAAVSFIGWLVLWSLGSVTFALAAIFGDRRSAAILDSPLHRFGDAWQWVVGVCALILILVVVARTRFVTAAVSAWFISLASLAIVGWMTHGFSWWILPVLFVALFLAAYAGLGARSAA